jgi:hypothetical protein
VIGALVRDQVQRGAVEQEPALQLRTAQLTGEPLVRGHLITRQELNGRPTPRSLLPLTAVPIFLNP